MRKPMGIIANLPLEIQQAVEEWLFDSAPTLTYEQARGRLMHEQGIDISLDSLSRYYQRRSHERMLERLATTAQNTHEVREQCQKNQSAAFEALMEMIGQAAYELRVKEQTLTLPQLRELAGLASLGLQARMSEERMRLLALEVAVKDRDVALRETKYKNEQEMELARLDLEKAQLELEQQRLEKPGGISQEAIDEIVRRAKLM